MDRGVRTLMKTKNAWLMITVVFHPVLQFCFKSASFFRTYRDLSFTKGSSGWSLGVGTNSSFSLVLECLLKLSSACRRISVPGISSASMRSVIIPVMWILKTQNWGLSKKSDKEERPFKSRCGWVAWEVWLQLAMRTTLWISHVTRPQIQNKIFIAQINWQPVTMPALHQEKGWKDWDLLCAFTRCGQSWDLAHEYPLSSCSKARPRKPSRSCKWKFVF